MVAFNNSNFNAVTIRVSSNTKSSLGAVRLLLSGRLSGTALLENKFALKRSIINMETFGLGRIFYSEEASTVLRRAKRVVIFMNKALAMDNDIWVNKNHAVWKELK